MNSILMQAGFPPVIILKQVGLNVNVFLKRLFCMFFILAWKNVLLLLKFAG